MLSYKEIKDILEKEYPEYFEILDLDGQIRSLFGRKPEEFEKVLIRSLTNSTDTYRKWNEVKGLVDTANGLNQQLYNKQLRYLSNIIEKKPELINYIKSDFPEIVKELENMKNNLKEAEEDIVEDTNTDDFQVYMNTWKNYNEYGADLEAYGIKNGWMTIDQAIEFCDKYAEDEPFINDVDNNTGLDIEVSEYDNAPTKLEELKELFDRYDSLSSDEQDAVKAILEANGDGDIDNAIDIAESGDYLFLRDVDNEEDLAREYIDMIGGIDAAVSKDRIMDFIDADSIKEGWQDDINSQYEEDDPDWYEVDDYMVQEDIESVLGSGNQQAIDNFIDQYFDYDSFGRELAYDFTFVDGGAIQIY